MERVYLKNREVKQLRVVLSSSRGVFKPPSQIDPGHVGSQNFPQCFNSVMNLKVPTERDGHRSEALEMTVLRMLSVCNRHSFHGHSEEVGDGIAPHIQVEKRRYGAGETTCPGLTAMQGRGGTGAKCVTLNPSSLSWEQSASTPHQVGTDISLAPSGTADSVTG